MDKRTIADKYGDKKTVRKITHIQYKLTLSSERQEDCSKQKV